MQANPEFNQISHCFFLFNTYVVGLNSYFCTYMSLFSI